MHPTPKTPILFLYSPFLSLLLVAEVTHNEWQMNPGVIRAMGVVHSHRDGLSSTSL